MKRIERDNYINIQGWMITELELSGYDLLCYAIIYGFSQDKESCMTGGLDYIQSCLLVSRPTVVKVLKGLVKRGLIVREENITNCRRIFYRVPRKEDEEKGSVKDFNQGEVKEDNDVSKQDLLTSVKGFNQPPFNIKNNNNKYNNKENKDDLFLEFWNTYNKKVGRVPAIRAWKKLTADDKRKAIEGIKPYQESMHFDKHYIKHPATYLNQRTWEDDFTDYNSKSFYEIREDDTDKEKRFKEHMRKKHPAIEQVRCPLSMCAYIDLANVYGSESVEQELTKIENNIALYKLSDISYEIAKSLEKGRI